MVKQYKSDAFAAAHEVAMDLATSGLVSKQTMRAFDEMCLIPVEEMRPDRIRALRQRECKSSRLCALSQRENASQVVFARYLNVTASVVSQWERGEETPRGASLKLLSLVEEKGLNAIA